MFGYLLSKAALSSLKSQRFLFQQVSTHPPADLLLLRLSLQVLLERELLIHGVTSCAAVSLIFFASGALDVETLTVSLFLISLFVEGPHCIL